VEYKGRYTLFAFWTFAIFAFVLVFPTKISGISFAKLSSDTGTRIGALETSSMEVLLRQLFLISIYSFFILVATVCSNKHKNTKNNIYLYISIAAGVFACSFIVKEARDTQVYSGFACISLLCVLFPQSKKKVVLSLLIPIVAIIAFITFYRFFTVYSSESYSDAFQQGDIELNKVTQYFELYSLGPLHITSVLELSQQKDLFTLERLLFGLLRSTMGTNFLVKNMDWKTNSEIFNEFISSGLNNTGILLPISGLCILYLSVFLSPILCCFIYIIALKLEIVIKKSDSTFFIFFASYIYIRLATCIICTNINTILTLVSTLLLSSGVLYIFNYIFTNDINKRIIHNKDSFSV
jgi:hypothetical protein